MKIKTFKAWLMFFIIATLGGAICGGIMGAIMGATGETAEVIMVVTLIVGIAVSYLAYMWSVKKYIAPQFEEIDLTHELRIEASGIPEEVQKEIKEISENNNLTYGERFEAIQEVIEKREAI